MRDYKQEFKEIGCSGDFEKERLEEKSDCLKCYLSDYCGSIFEKAERARWDAKSPEERAAQEKLSKGLKELY